MTALAMAACGGASSKVDAGNAVSDAGGALDAGPVVDAGGAVDAGAVAPIVAPAEQWTWVDFADSTCANGVPTGIAVNPKAGSEDLFIYLQGGGACWEGVTCFVLKSAVNIETGYTAASFETESDRGLPGFNRDVPTNPFKGAHFVFVPYCTGDVHSGDSTQVISGRTVRFQGGANTAAYLKRLKVTFPDVKRVYLTGSSAGAFGAQLNYTRVSQTFPTAEVHVLADSGQMINPSGTLLTDWVAAWNITVPQGCTDCLTHFPSYIDWLAGTHPNRRFALLAYSRDGVLRRFFNYEPAPYQVQTELLLSAKYDPRANAKYFYLAGDDHTMLGSQFNTTGAGNVTLNEFITKWYVGDPTWANVKP